MNSTGQQRKMSNKQGIIFFATLLVIASISIYFWYSNLMAGVEEDDARSKTISMEIQNLFTQKKIGDYPLVPGQPKWGGDYLVLEDLYTDNVALRYSTKWNEKLGTQSNFPGDNAKGIVMISSWIRNEGEFKASLGIPIDTKPTRHSYVISYLDISKKTVVARDTLMGGDPPIRIKRGESGWGKAPDDGVVVQTINNRLK